MVMMLTMNIVVMMMNNMMIILIIMLMGVMRVLKMMIITNITLIIVLMFLMVMPVKSKPVQQGCPCVDRPMVFKRVLKYGSKWLCYQSRHTVYLRAQFMAHLPRLYN